MKADDTNGERRGGFVHEGGAFVVQVQVPKAFKPSESALNDPSSLPLLMEDGAVRRQTEDHTTALHGLPEAHPDAMGFVFLVNGKPSGAEIYGTPTLFLKLWSK